MQQVFQEDSSQKVGEFPTYSDTLKPDAYVSQFLNIFNFSDDIQQDRIPEDLDGGLQPISVSVEELVLPKRKSRSAYHNFQKHLVNTFRRFVKEQKFPDHSDKRLVACQKKLWEVFCKSKKLNKTLVCMTLGNISKFSMQQIQSYGFRSVIDEFTVAIVVDVQQVLKQNIIKQMEGSRVNESIENGRITNKEQFKYYFENFITDLKERRLMHRTNLAGRAQKQIQHSQ